MSKQQDQPQPANHAKPSYYESYNDKEVYQMMVDIWGEEKFIAFCEMNAFKYRMRMGKKPGESLEKEMSKVVVYENLRKDYLALTKITS